MSTRERRIGRAKLRSPGRPPVLHRSERRPFWRVIASGCSSEDAARAAGISPAVGTRWFREHGGMPPSHLSRSSPPTTGRYLSLGEREQIALLRAKECGVREIARQLERSASTISRELRRNASTRGGGFSYRAITAQWHADRAARRPKRAKLVINEKLRRYSKIVLLARSSHPAARGLPARLSPGPVGAEDEDSIGAGRAHGALRKFQIVCI